MLPLIHIQTNSVRFADLPHLLGPYARTAPIYVYLQSGGTLTATRLRLKKDAELLLILGPTGTLPEMGT